LPFINKIANLLVPILLIEMMLATGLDVSLSGLAEMECPLLKCICSTNSAASQMP
jgi:hypothetical protein